MKTPPRTMFEKVWNAHVVAAPIGEPTILYIDLHLLHEVSSAQAFDGLRLERRPVRRPDRCLATVDHNVPTTSDRFILLEQRSDPLASEQIQALRRNCLEFGIEFMDVGSPHQGIVHVLGPELGCSKPGMTIVCGDSHTSTHGAFGALAFGIGTSEVEHVLALQCLPQPKPRTLRITIEGLLGSAVTAKDIALFIIGHIGTDGANGHVVEYAGSAIRSLSMEGRMTLCNMSIESGARAGMIAPDQTTFAYLQGRPCSPQGEHWELALARWTCLATDTDATFDRELFFDSTAIQPCVTWGTTPAMVVPISGRVPAPPSGASSERTSHLRALEYMGLQPGTPIQAIGIDRVFLGSCTNSRIEDLRAAADIVRGYQVHPRVQALAVPGSQQVKAQAEREGLHEVFLTAGFQWRESGCSMCLGMNPDSLNSAERCASTSNRNFEGRQGRGARTHLCSPAMAAAAAITGHFTDVRSWVYRNTDLS